MTWVGKLAGVAAIGALLYGGSYFTRDRADPSWSTPAKAIAVAAKPIADRVPPANQGQVSTPAKAGPAKIEPVMVGQPVRAAAGDPDNTGSLPVASEPAAQIVPAAPVHAKLVQRRAPKHARASRPGNRYTSIPAPALRQAYTPAALPTYREPIQFRLADRGH